MAIGATIFARNAFHLIIPFVIIIYGTKSCARHNPARFISIDCGGTKRSVDHRTNLSWVEDGDHMVTGENGVVQDPSMINSSYDNYEALLSFRYFPEEGMRRKYCYELHLKTNNVWFLLRAMFLHGNASVLRLPIEFDVYVNATLWTSLKYTEHDDLFSPIVHESIFYLAPEGTNMTHVCLVPIQGVPFISTLELRRFDLGGVMYESSLTKPSNQHLYFTKSMRWNTGTTEDINVRYPDDPYDRIWTPSPPISSVVGYQGYEEQKNTLVNVHLKPSEKFSTRLGPKINYVPFKVMKDAWSPKTGDSIFLHMDLPETKPADSAYGIFYFALLNESTRNTTVTLKMFLDETDYTRRTFNITREPSQQSFVHSLDFNFSGVRIDGPFALNAVEFYREDNFIPTATQHDDARVVSAIKKVLNMTGWQGDPCVPVPNDWIGCEFDYYWGSKWFVINLTLSHVENSSRLLELNDYTTGWVIYFLSITNSGINSTVFQSLMEKFICSTCLNTLNMSFNKISEFPDAKWWIHLANIFQPKYYLESVDFSYNRLSQLPHFKDIPFSNQTKMLNFSHNQITGEFPDKSSFTNLSALQELIISNNYFSGEIPSSLSVQNLPSLQILDISYNSFSGEFPSNYYYTVDGDNSLQRLTINVDNNELTGTLNLTLWYQKLKSLSEMSTRSIHSVSSEEENSTTVNMLLSMLNNKISDIQPSMKDFQPLIESLIKTENFNQSGVLLGGNPYCQNAKHFTQRYLCRSSLTDVVDPDDVKKNKKAIILGSSLGASFLLLCFVFLMVVIWRLSRKVYMLKRVEQELASRSVQPPYYSLYDLKVATRNFHSDNHLGRGTFGVVYKGVLSNGVTVAVKRLFNANKKQVLNDFLNEVVLITGIKHTNLIQLKGCCIENEERILVYGYAENGNVEDALWGEDLETVLSWRSRFKICLGVASGLTYLHEKLQPRIIHRDIKPANILLDRDLNPKVADFGLAKHFAEEINVHFTQVISGTRGYFAPEYLMEGVITTKIDVFSFGILILEIVSGRKNFNALLPPEEIQLRSWAQTLQKSGSTLKLLDKKIHGDYSEQEVLKVINIALMCVRNDPDLRPSMSEVETMLLEGEEKMFDKLWGSGLKKKDSSSNLGKLYTTFKEGVRDNTFSKLLSGSGSQASREIGSSTMSQLEAYPLLRGDSTEAEGEGSGGFTSSDTRDEYLRALRSMKRSLSDRINRPSPR